ncbi:hypothetical protein PMI41_00685, partial [Phyllobacterium sp. YR531]
MQIGRVCGLCNYPQAQSQIYGILGEARERFKNSVIFFIISSKTVLTVLWS